MSAIVKEVYDALRSAGVSDEQATAAAKAVPLADNLATRADIDALRAEMKVLELRMTIKLFTGLGMTVATVKALDFLIG
ncbi:MAG: integrase [Gammaproteobacteria bacterium]|nr:integrase [Gammaproteobacteria bacterium]MDE0367733.1 integrase [Gammaproteobacteria bacterium]